MREDVGSSKGMISASVNVAVSGIWRVHHAAVLFFGCFLGEVSL